MYLYSTYLSPIGQLTMSAHDGLLCELSIGKSVPTQCSYSEIFDATRHWLDIYFSGHKPDFTPSLEFHGTDFQKKVWTELLNIDFGQTSTYGQVATRVGCRSAQAVGQAISRNPLLIIVPCHRVIATNNKIGGFSAGLNCKIALLKNESSNRIFSTSDITSDIL